MGDGEGQEGLACFCPRGRRIRHDWVIEQQQRNNSGSSIFSFLRSLYTVPHSGCSNLYYHCVEGFPSPHPFQHLLFVEVSMIDILAGVR